ncbi:MAG: hypothetical protein AUG51_10140 [Acidobacteria bacterium 13_1_20CM_3_53_8]|nr:MAG: hypothetical protein AUG51_10140 [Acidobacteria bacterium 13_1_20CM_3_53_8]
METRQIKGLHIAASSHIQQDGKLWIVPSQTSNRKYTVRYGRKEQTCTCPDFESRRRPCKHIHAVYAHLHPTQITQIPELPRKPTYKQAWHEYNKAQTNEKAKFQELLYELCRGIESLPKKPGAGRTRLPLGEMIFAVVFKVYSLISGRRFISDLKETQRRGYISRCPHFNSIFNYLELEEMTDCLTSLISQSSLPLKAIEQDFAVDSSGFSTGIATRWFKTKYSDEPEEISMMGWLKAHIMCGVKTNIVTSVEISDGYSNDILYFKPLVEATSQNFKLREVSADKAYLSAENLRQVAAKGAESYIPFKINSNAHHYNDKSGVWYRLWHYYSYNNNEFMMHYHKRSNVETTFSMIKAKFGERLRSKTATAQKNEILCKVLCHNLCCLVQSMYELGVEIDCWKRWH